MSELAPFHTANLVRIGKFLKGFDQMVPVMRSLQRQTACQLAGLEELCRVLGEKLKNFTL